MKKSIENLSMDFEQIRLAALNRYKILDTPPEAAYDNLAKLACEIFQLPVCVISFTGKDEIFYKANIGLNGKISEPRKGSLLDGIIMQGEVIILENFQNQNDFFYSLHDIKFLSLAPLITHDGHHIGNFAVMGSEACIFGEKESLKLQMLANTAIDLTEFRLAKSEQESLEEENRELYLQQKKLKGENLLLQGYKEQIAQANNVLEVVLESYELLFKLAPVAIGICSFHDKVIWQANDALKTIFGGREIIGTKLDSLVSQINGKQALKTIGLVSAGKCSYHSKDAKLKIQHADGAKNIYVNFSLQFVGRMGDESQNLMFILADVTEQVVLNQITREANAVLMSAIEDTGLGYTIVEFDTGKMLSNDQLKANYGYSSQEALSYPDIFRAMLPQYREVISKAVNQAIVSKGIYQAEYEVKWRDGSVHRIKAFGKPMYDADGKATHIIGLNKIISGS